MHKLYDMKNCLINAAQYQTSNLQNCDAEEFGEVIDMIKDIEEAIYYCTITKAMEEKDSTSKERMYYNERGGYKYDDNSSSYADNYRANKSHSSDYEHDDEREYPVTMRDSREGRSPEYRRMYMESKEMHQDKITAMKDLEKYMQELSSDICEMIENASPEEKQLLQKKIVALSNKIQ